MLEYEITEFVITNKEELQTHLKETLQNMPDDFVLSVYEERIEELKRKVAKEMNLSYADVATVIDESFIDKWLT